jgi:copper oxidase (laccase) domain-containing protein
MNTFHENVRIAVSQSQDGTMKKTGHTNPASVDENRRSFLNRHHISMEQTVLVQLDYGTADFCLYKTVKGKDGGDGIVREPSITSDALVTQTAGLALFLPIADCVGAVLYDPTTNTLMVSHLGRHNIEQDGGQKSVKYLVQNHTVNPRDVLVWLSPSAGKENYPLFAFDNHSLQEVVIEQLENAGIIAHNISRSDIDTTRDVNYFSHSEFQKGHRSKDGRFAIVAMLK